MPTSLTRPPAGPWAKDPEREKRRIISLLEELKNQEEVIRLGGGLVMIIANDATVKAAARLWVDAIIDPAETRSALIWALEAAALNPWRRDFRTGVLQT